MATVIEVRIDERGQYNPDDLNRLGGLHMVGVRLPADPRNGPALVTVEEQVETDPQAKPQYFRP